VDEVVRDLNEIIYVGMTRTTGLLNLLVKESFLPLIKKQGLNFQSAR
jgi:hypothetical protein